MLHFYKWNKDWNISEQNSKNNQTKNKSCKQDKYLT